MEYLIIAFVAIIIIGSVVSSVSTANKAKSDEAANTTRRKAKTATKKQSTKRKEYQPMTSHLNTDYTSRLTDLGAGDSTYDTVADIGDEDIVDNTSISSIVDLDILQSDDDGNMDIGGIATAIVLGQVLGAPKGKR